MGGKGKGKDKKASRTQQQQQAAARRSPARPGSAATGARATRETVVRDAEVREADEPPASPAPPPDRCYLDISAVRIQDWLGRTPDLKFRRGGSVLLSEATARKAWDGRLPPGAGWNEEAGQVDGVVSLVMDPPNTDALAVARHVAQRMRAVMPHCHLQAVSGRGASYAAAYADMARARRDGDLLIDAPSAPPELILAKPCDQCRSAAAVRKGVAISDGEKPVDLCAECDARLDAAGRTAGRPSQAPLPERRLREALGQAGMAVTDFSATFADMAAAGERDRDDAATQLALIYADGNKVGAFLTRAAGIDGGPAKAEIAPLLDRATLGALAQAVIDRFDGWPKPPVLVNLAGGDDLLVSVPAVDAWLFTKTLPTSFTALLDKATATSDWPREARENIPTLAAGMIFHHLKTPFSDVVRLAAEQLRLAKAKTRGGAAVAFLDLTADGNQPPPGRAPVTLDYLTVNAGRLQQIADLPPSRRHTLLGLLRDGETQDFIARLTDFDSKPLWELAAGPGADAPAVRGALAASGDKRDELRRALDIARHWHAEPRDDDSSDHDSSDHDDSKGGRTS
ncbi:MAG: Cas10/Cmr2 second palm domain-containing protein [Trebonia sp.]